MPAMQENRDNKNPIDVQDHLCKRAMIVLTARELDHCEVEVEDSKVKLKVKATVAGGILTAHDIKRAIARWVRAGCPNPITYNDTANRLRENSSAKEEELISFSNKLKDADEKKHELEEQVSDLKAEIQGLTNAYEQERDAKQSLSKQVRDLEKDRNAQNINNQTLTRRVEEAQEKLDLLHDFVDIVRHESFFTRLRLALSKEYTAELYRKITE